MSSSPGPCARPCKNARGWGRGFTLVEVAVAAGVMALALVSAVPVMQRAFRHVDQARNLELAGNIMQTEIEKERLMAWALVSDATYVPTIDTSFTKVPSIAGRFTLSRNVEIPSGHEGELVRVTLSVTWRSVNNRQTTRSYTTYVGKGGLQAYYHDKN